MAARLTTGDVIDALGGTTATAKLLGKGKSAVSNYRSLGYFPEYLHKRLTEICTTKGVPLEGHLFKQLSEDARQQKLQKRRRAA